MLQSYYIFHSLTKKMGEKMAYYKVTAAKPPPTG